MVVFFFVNFDLIKIFAMKNTPFELQCQPAFLQPGSVHRIFDRYISYLI